MEELLFFITGLLVGAVMAVMILKNIVPKLMVLENKSKYGFDETLQQMQSAVDSLGWKTPHVHNLQATMTKFNYDVNKVTVMEVCKPDIAHMILSRDKERMVSALMPCRISIYEKSDGQVYVSRLNSLKMGGLFSGIIKQAMNEAGEESEHIVQSVVQ